MVVLRLSSEVVSREGDLLTLLFSFSADAVPILLPSSNYPTSLENAFLTLIRLDFLKVVFPGLGGQFDPPFIFQEKLI